MAESEASTSTSTPAVPFFKKKSKGGASKKAGTAAAAPRTKERSTSPASSSTLKRRTRGDEDEEDDEEAGGPSVVRLSRKQEYNPLRQGTSAAFNKRRKGGDRQEGDEDEDDDDDEYTANSIGVQFSDRPANRRPRSPSPGNVLSGNAALSKAGEAVVDEDEEGANSGLYRGAAAYQAKLPAGSKVYTDGIKAPSASIRTITLVDYQPDVCKDYKETGFCGFGDSCKFLHDRGDYLHGWQLDNQFLSDQAGNLAPVAAQAVEEELPFACLICRNPFTDPIVTRCGHYFDSKCAIKRFAKTPKCFACGASTAGIFNKATKILERKEKNQRARIEAREKEEGGAGDEYGEGGVEIEGLGEE